MVVRRFFRAEDCSNFLEQNIEIVRLLNRIDHSGLQHFGADRRFEITAGDDGPHARPAFLHLEKSLAPAETRQAEVANYEPNLVTISFEKGDSFHSVSRRQDSKS